MPKASAQESRAAADERTSRTRERLLAAAATAIARRGWDGATTRQVAALAGVNQGLVHYHFGSIDALRREAAFAVLAREVGGPTAALMEAPSLADGVQRCLAAVAELDTESEGARVLFEAMLASARDAELRAMMREILDEFRGLLAEKVRAAGGAHPDAAALAVTAALDGVYLHLIVDPDLDVARSAAPLVAALELPASSRPPRPRAKKAR